MTTATAARPSLREIILDALHDAYYGRLAEIEGCRDCRRNPAGVCGDHQADNEMAAGYEDARKQMERSPDSPGVLAALYPAAAEEGAR